MLLSYSFNYYNYHRTELLLRAGLNGFCEKKKNGIDLNSEEGDFISLNFD